MQGIAGVYIRACRAANAEPNHELLAPLVEVFQKLQPPEDPPES